MMKQIQYWFLCGIFGMAVILNGCKKEDPLPDNPYDGVDYGTGSDGSYTPDPNSIVGIYENILRKKCDNPGCHDGHFEPDFRSIQSSWSTLVYHEIVKNTADSSYTYRVVPRSTTESILWKRVTWGNAQLQQMPATGQLLTQEELDQIQAWIDDGARDMFGNLPQLPNNEPLVAGYLAFNSTFQTRYDDANNRLDSLFYNPMKLPQNSTINLVFFVEDDSTETANLQVNQLRMSYDINDFSSPTLVNAYYFAQAGAWVAPINTGNFSAGDTIYFRYYVNDGDQSFNTEFPREDQPEPYKTYAAFYVVP